MFKYISSIDRLRQVDTLSLRIRRCRYIVDTDILPIKIQIHRLQGATVENTDKDINESHRDRYFVKDADTLTIEDTDTDTAAIPLYY